MIRDVRVFLASLTEVNTEIAFYIFGSIDQNNGLPERAFPPDREEALGTRMVQLGQALQERAHGRRVTVEGTPSNTEVQAEQQESGILPDRKMPQIPEF